MIRPCSMIATEVQNSFISARICEEIRTVFFSSAIRRRMFLRSMRPWGSIPLAGSSSSSTWGSGIIVLASIIRCRIPRDSSPTIASRFSVRPDHLEVFVHGPAPAGLFQPIAGGEQVEELPDLQVFVDWREVGHEADDPADVLGMLADVDPHDLDLAISRLQQAEHGAHRGRLAGAVGADQPADLARPDFQRQVAHGADVIVVDAQVLDPDHPGDLPSSTAPRVLSSLSGRRVCSAGNRFDARLQPGELARRPHGFRLLDDGPQCIRQILDFLGE